MTRWEEEDLQSSQNQCQIVQIRVFAASPTCAAKAPRCPVAAAGVKRCRAVSLSIRLQNRKSWRPRMWDGAQPQRLFRQGTSILPTESKNFSIWFVVCKKSSLLVFDALLSLVRGNLLWLDFDWPKDMFFFVNRVKFFNRIHGHRKHIRIPWTYKSEMLALAGPWGSWGVSSHSPGGSVAMGIRSHWVKDFSLWESLIVLCICQSKAM